MHHRNRLLLAGLLAAILLSGCTSAAFLAANLPSAFGPYERTKDLAYGPQSRQRLDVYVPEAGASAARPVVVFIHGGSWSTGSKSQYRFVGSALAEAGYVAVLPNYRLSPDVAFPVFVEDAAQAVAWTLRTIGQYGGDPQRVYVMGHSAGAHIAMLVGLDSHYLADAGASTGQLAGIIGLSGPYDFRIDSKALHAVFDSAPRLQDTQPVNFVRGDAPPLLLIHGTEDRICVERHSIELSERIRAAGGRADLKLYPGLGHGDTVVGFTRFRRLRAPTLADVVAFIGPDQALIAAPD